MIKFASAAPDDQEHSSAPSPLTAFKFSDQLLHLNDFLELAPDDLVGKFPSPTPSTGW
jgi:hypothetical protein